MSASPVARPAKRLPSPAGAAAFRNAMSQNGHIYLPAGSALQSANGFVCGILKGRERRTRRRPRDGTSSGEDPLLQRVGADPIGELGRMAGPPDTKVGSLSGFDRSGVVEVEGAGGVAGDAGKGFLGRQPE